MSLQLQFASDLHIELKRNSDFMREHPLKPSAEILILAGDITNE